MQPHQPTGLSFRMLRWLFLMAVAVFQDGPTIMKQHASGNITVFDCTSAHASIANPPSMEGVSRLR